MKKLIFYYFLGFCGLLFIFSCSDDKFCIENFSYETTGAEISDVNIILPSGEEHSGTGLLGFPIKMGEYDMVLQTATISQIITESSSESIIVHYFQDNKGNSFWSKDTAVFTNIGEVGKATSIYTLDIIDGRGDFECAKGELTIDLFGNFIENYIDFTLTGEVCGGCE
jgi:hypothetical protein